MFFRGHTNVFFPEEDGGGRGGRRQTGSRQRGKVFDASTSDWGTPSTWQFSLYPPTKKATPDKLPADYFSEFEVMLAS